MRDISYLEAIREAMAEEMRRDERVFVLGEDIGVYGGAFQATQGFYEEFGEERVMDTPISESCIVGVATGVSLMGFRPIVEMQFADFISCAFDQIVNQAATLRYRYGGRACLPFVIRAPSGGGVHGGLYHSQNPEAWFFHRPGLKVVAPSTPYDAKGLLKAAIRDDNPVIYCESKYLYHRSKGKVPEEGYIVPLGTAEVKREGNEISLITYGTMVQRSLIAAEKFSEEEGVETEVLDLRTLLPLDKDTILQSVKKTGKVLIVHEDTRTGGIGGEIAAILAEEVFEYLDSPILRVTYPDTHVPFSPPLEEFCLPNEENILETLRRLAAY